MGRSSGVSIHIGKRVGARLVIEACRGVEVKNGVKIDKMRWIVKYHAPFAIDDFVYGMGDTEKEMPKFMRAVESYVKKFKEDYGEFEDEEYLRSLDEEEIKKEIIKKLNEFEDGVVNLLIYAFEVPYLTTKNG